MLRRHEDRQGAMGTATTGSSRTEVLHVDADIEGGPDAESTARHPLDCGVNKKDSRPSGRARGVKAIAHLTRHLRKNHGYSIY